MSLHLANINLEQLLESTSKELLDFQEKLTIAIEKRKEKDKLDVQNELHELAAKRGFSLGEILGKTRKKSAKKNKAARYKNPANDKETWAGHGRKPNWLLTLIAEGRNIEEFQV
jgi:DNA-binding protein H-NS